MPENKKMELVSPAGSWDALVAAINAGADAVYLGLNRFSARAFAENFELSRLKQAVDAAHHNGVKVYLAFNTLIKDSEMQEVAGLLNEYFSFCTDGIIIQDMGLYQVLSDLFPGIRIHASTQLSIHNLNSLEMLSELDFARAVLAREMTLGEITAISQSLPGRELEVFAHGSQCYCYSGSCYFSSFTGLRSGNRGRCTQPCRMKYNVAALPAGRKNTESRSGERVLLENSYVLSKSDLFTLDILPELSKAGVTALKIEGRMKNPEYVGIITAIYRKYIDLFYSGSGSYSVSKEDIYKATQIYSRELGHGYFKEEFPKDIVSMKKSGSIGNFLGRITGFKYSEPEKLKALKAGFKKPLKPGYRDKRSLQTGRIKSFQVKSNWPILIGDILQIWTNAGNEQLTVSSFKLLETLNGKYLYSIDADGKIKAGMGDRVFKSFDYNLDVEAKSYFAGGLKNKPGKFRKDASGDRFFAGTIPENYFGGKPDKGTGDFGSGIKVSDLSGFNILKTSSLGAANRAELKKLHRENLSAVPGLKVEIYDLGFADKILNESHECLKGIVINNFGSALNGADLNSGLLKTVFEKCREKRIDLIFKTPQVIYDNDLAKLESLIPALAEIGIKYFSVSNFGVLKTLLDAANGGIETDTDINIDIDFGFNVFNHKAASFFHGMSQKYKGINIKDICLSVELSLNEINDLISKSYSDSLTTSEPDITSSSVAAFKPVSHSEASLAKPDISFKKPVYSIYSYGYYPVMQSRFKLKYIDEKKPQGILMDYYLMDQKNYDFRIVEEFNGNISFLSSKKICVLFDIDKIIASGMGNLYIDARTFGPGEAVEIIRTYSKALQACNKNGPKGIEDLMASAKNNILFSDYTRGHLEREVL